MSGIDIACVNLAAVSHFTHILLLYVYHCPEMAENRLKAYENIVITKSIFF